MSEVIYSWCGENNFDEFTEGIKVIFPGCGEGYIDFIREDKKALAVLSRTDRAKWAKPMITRTNYKVSLDQKSRKVRLGVLSCDFAEEGVAPDYDELNKRLTEFEARQ